MKGGTGPSSENIRLQRTTYEASGGTEVFLCFEDSTQNVLIGFVRLRIPSQTAHRAEITVPKTALIRELHVFGQTVPVGTRLESAFQHKGYGARLIAEAERIALEDYDRDKIIVISALGTKPYYSRFHYRHDGPYMSKLLN